MATTDPRIDAYIENVAKFAQPILIELRRRVHKGCPEVVETIKWGMPAFEYQGPLADMAAFKGHCTFGFWKHELLFGDDETWKKAMGSFGRITKLSELPSKAEFARLLARAMELNEQNVKAPRTKTAKKSPTKTPAAFAAALAKHKKAKTQFEAFAPSHKREYVEWIAEAKREETRERRIEQALEWIAEGKHRNWKYERR